MANFFAVVGSQFHAQHAGAAFRRGLEASRHLGLGSPKATLESDWCRVATIPRRDGTGATLTRDALSGGWLVAIGSWFHRDGFASGAEARLLDLIVQRGTDEIARELEGFFVIVHGDARKREVQVVTDLAGSCHVFQRADSGGIALSASSLLLAALDETRLDPVAAQELLAHGVLYEERTLHREVRKLRPTHVHRFPAEGSPTAARYWDIAALPHESLGASEAADAIHDGLVRAANRIAELHPRVLCDLTGGPDSRAVVAGFLGSRRPFSTTVAGHEGTADVEVSASLAAKLDVHHERVRPAEPSSFSEIEAAIPFTDGEHDLVEQATALDAHRQLSRGWNVSVNGTLGSLARGAWHDGSRTFDPRRVAAKHLVGPFDASIFRSASRLDFADHYAAVIDRLVAPMAKAPAATRVDAVHLLLGTQSRRGRIATATNRLWPSLSPFLFRSVLEPALLASAAARARGGVIRRMLARHEPRLALHPLDDGMPAMPMTPITAWRFWRAPLHGARKMLESRNLIAPAPAPGPKISARFKLWLDDTVREMLQPRRMRLAEILEPAALAAFFERSRRRDFEHSGQWARILTVEATLSLLAGVRTRLGAPARIAPRPYVPLDAPPPPEP